MADIECPYCGADQEICHDDGYGYDEDRIHNQECSECDNIFAFTTSTWYSYRAAKADCLNGAPHNFKPTVTYPKEFTRMVCDDCGEERKCTDEEMKAVFGE